MIMSEYKKDKDLKIAEDRLVGKETGAWTLLEKIAVEGGIVMINDVMICGVMSGIKKT